MLFKVHFKLTIVNLGLRSADLPESQNLIFLKISTSPTMSMVFK